MAERFDDGGAAVHLRQRRQLHRRRRRGRLFVRPAVRARRSPARCAGRRQRRAHRARQRRRLRPRVLPPAHRPRPRRRHRPRALDQRQLAQPAASPSPRRAARGLLTVGLAGYDGGEMARVGRRRPLPRGATPTASTASRRPRRRWRSTLWRSVQRTGRRRAPSEADDRRRDDREAAVLERIEAFRRRRPRAHRRGRHAGPRRRRQGVGRAGRRRVPRRVRHRRARRRWPTPPRSTLPGGRAAGVQHRLVRRAAPPLPRRLDRPPRRARHGQRPRHDRAPGRSGCRPRSCIEEGFAIAELRDDRRPTWPRPRPTPASRSSPATPRSSDRGAADGLYITTAGVGVIPAGRAARRRPRAAGRRRARVGHASPTTAWR